MPVENFNRRRPMDSETVIALILLVIGLLIIGGFSITVWIGMLSLINH